MGLFNRNDKDPLYLTILKNIGEGLNENVKALGKHKYKTFDYYRAVRNRAWINYFRKEAKSAASASS